MFTESQRALFSYWNGHETVAADPDRIRRRLFKALQGEDLDGLMTKIRGPANPDALEPHERQMVDVLVFEAEEKLLEAIYFAFDSHALDGHGQGMMEREAFKAYRDWCEFMADLKKKDESLPTGSTLSEQGPDSQAA